MTKVVIVGYDEVFAQLIKGCISAGYKPVGVFRYDRVKYKPWFLKIKDCILPSKDKSFLDGYKLYEIKATSVNSEAFRKENDITVDAAGIVLDGNADPITILNSGLQEQFPGNIGP